MSRWVRTLAFLAVLAPIRPSLGQDRAPAIAWIARRDLADAAVAVADPARPVVYYNPTILQDLGPRLTRFVRAHETAHITLRHTPAIFAHLGEAGRIAAHRRAELDADCHAARVLAEEDRSALFAAIDYFRTRGRLRISDLHPTAAERAAELERCLANHDREAHQ